MTKTNKPEIAKLYNAYIQTENEQNRGNRYVGKEKYFHASGGNMCIRKHWFSTNKAPETDKADMVSSRIMRLGTVVHSDYENALNWWQKNRKIASDIILNNYSTNNSSISSISTEGEILLPELNVRGFYDAVFVMESGEVYLYDFKTIRSYPYKLKFGRDPRPEKVPTHEVQLATYGLGVREQFGRLDGMFLYYYNKDSSVCKEREVDLEFLQIAQDYWIDVNEKASSSIPPPVKLFESPMQKWECNYCIYLTHCQEN